MARLDFLDLAVFDPTAVFPQLCDVVEVPVKAVGGIIREWLGLDHEVQWRSIVVTERGNERRLAEIRLHNIVLGLLGVRHKVVTVTVRIVMHHKITREKSEVVAPLAAHRLYNLHRAQHKRPRRVTWQTAPVVGFVHNLAVWQGRVHNLAVELGKVRTVGVTASHRGTPRAITLATYPVSRAGKVWHVLKSYARIRVCDQPCMVLGNWRKKNTRLGRDDGRRTNHTRQEQVLGR